MDGLTADLVSVAAIVMILLRLQLAICRGDTHP
jgi:hypothetical protein